MVFFTGGGFVVDDGLHGLGYALCYSFEIHDARGDHLGGNARREVCSQGVDPSKMACEIDLEEEIL